jgi:hypothetical protein
MRARRRELPAAAVLALACLLAAVGCAGQPAPHSRENSQATRVVLERGHLAQNRPWQLAASEQGGELGLYLENPSGGDYSDAVGFAGGPGAGFWMEGSGPGSSVFYYGPVPAAAVTVRLSAPGRAPIRVPTRLIPARDGLPRGRFFIVDPPGPPSVNWNVTLLDSAGHEVPFADF